ncbi:MAG: hypothetical protein JXB17_00345, partial [Bacteroidales bacterium]|nr:hypothetical protein [Bacteroidales bacterium]
MIKYPEKINKIISDALSTISNQNNIMQCYKAWDKYLSKYFTYPFDAIVTETEESEVFEYGDKISVKRIDSFFDLYGLIVEVR